MWPSCPNPSRSRSLPRRFRRRSTMPRIGGRMASNQRILLVEDDVLIGMMLADMFDALDLPEPAQATSNEEALALIAAEPLAGALVDINLGDEKGWPVADALAAKDIPFAFTRSEEHKSELQSLMRIPYAVFCLKKK